MTNLVSNFECLFWFCCQPSLKSDPQVVQFTQNYLFWVKALEASLEYLEGAPNFKTQPQLKKITPPNIQNSTLNSSFDALSKRHDPDLSWGPASAPAPAAPAAAIFLLDHVTGAEKKSKLQKHFKTHHNRIDKILTQLFYFILVKDCKLLLLLLALNTAHQPSLQVSSFTESST